MNLRTFITSIFHYFSSFFVNKRSLSTTTTSTPIIPLTYYEKLEKRLQKNQDKYVHSFSITNIDWNEHSSDIGDVWKTRILCENTHSGNVYIIYNSTFNGFYYYSDSTVQNRYLMLLIMKFVLLFRCRQLYITSSAKVVEETVLDTREITITEPSKCLPYVKSKLRKNNIISTPTPNIRYGGRLREFFISKVDQTHHKKISYAMFNNTALLATYCPISSNKESFCYNLNI